MIVVATLGLSNAILAAAALSFLGLGAQPPQPEWGAMLSAGRDFFNQAPWLMLYPGLAIAGTVLAFNLLGDAIREAIDPRSEAADERVLDVARPHGGLGGRRWSGRRFPSHRARRWRSSANPDRARASRRCRSWGCCPPRRTSAAIVALRGPTEASPMPTPAPDARRAHRHDLPGADDLAQPGADDRAPDDRGAGVHRGMPRRARHARGPCDAGARRHRPSPPRGCGNIRTSFRAACASG